MRIEVDLFGTNPNNINDITWDTVCATDVAAMDKIGVRNIGVKYYLGNMNYYTHTNNTHWGNMIMINASGGYIYYTMISWSDSTVRNYPSTKVDDAYVHKTPAYYRGVIRLKPTARLDGSFSIPISDYKPIGDYVDYDAGEWTEEDFKLIENSSKGQKPNETATLPNKQGQFGGFIKDQSRNTSSKQYKSGDMTTTDGSPKSDGWRIWDIDENTGDITIISAGNPETYYHANGYSVESLEILKNRNYTMYENEYAKSKSARIITGDDVTDWYNKQYGTNYQLKDNGTNVQSTFYRKAFSALEPISLLENGAFYWIATSYDAKSLYRMYPGARAINHDGVNNLAFRCTYFNYSKIWSTNRQNQWRWN